MTLTAYRTLGRSGLVVSPAALGTMTFGNGAWGSDEAGSRAVFDAYVEAGGNFVDTADVYAAGRSESLLGTYIADRKLRDRIVLATKSGFNVEAGNPHAGGNGRKSLHRAVESSLGRLRTDYIDLYWMHVYDMVTPVEEVLQSLGDLVRAGKIRYFGFSDLPAWYGVKAATLASVQGVPGPIAMQLEYSLVERNIEREHVPAALECGMGLTPWSPLAGGFLSGKYTREGESAKGAGRLSGSNPFQGPFTKFTDRNWQVLDTLQAVAREVERPPAQVALAWVAARPGVTAPIIGASTPAQLLANVAALDLTLTPEQRASLDDSSAPATVFPYGIFTPAMNAVVFGGAPVARWRG